MFWFLYCLPLYWVEWLQLWAAHPMDRSSREVQKRTSKLLKSSPPFQFCFCVNKSGQRSLWFEIQSLWGQHPESLDPVTFFRSVKVGLFPMYLLYYQSKKISREWYQACGVKTFGHWLFQIWMVAIHSYMEHILRFSYVLFLEFFKHPIRQTTLDVLQLTVVLTRCIFPVAELLKGGWHEKIKKYFLP